jgi:hypothetical protein
MKMFEDDAFLMSALLYMETRLVSCSGSFCAEKTVSVTNWIADLDREKFFPQPLTENLSRPIRGKSVYYSVTSTQKYIRVIKLSVWVYC